MQRIVKRENLIENVKTMGAVLGNLLRQSILPLELVGDVRGRGLFWAVEFMRNAETKTPFPSGTQFCDRVVRKSLELGLSILGNLGVTGDVYVDHVLICPPYTVTEGDIERIVALLKQAIEECSVSLIPAI